MSEPTTKLGASGGLSQAELDGLVAVEDAGGRPAGAGRHDAAPARDDRISRGDRLSGHGGVDGGEVRRKQDSSAAALWRGVCAATVLRWRRGDRGQYSAGNKSNDGVGSNMIPFAIAGVQMHVAALHSNVEGMRQRLDVLMARFPWTQMAVFSELAPYGPLTRFAQPFPNDEIAGFQEDARRHKIWLIPGSMFEKAEDGLIYNTSIVINPDGEIVATYRKMFPFRPYESDVAAGTNFCVFDVPGVGRFGLSICYDIWFPETTRQLTSQGVEVLLHPVLTGTTDRDAELAIARATAAQFQCYVFDVNGLAAGGVGKSCVIDPSANVLHQSDGQEEMFPIEIDLGHVRRQRETGLKGLGQLLKSFRDRPVDFSVYDRTSGSDAYLQTLGPLQTPAQGSRAGLDSPDPRSALADTQMTEPGGEELAPLKGWTGAG